MGFIDEIADQGKALRDLIEFYRGAGDDLLCRLGHMVSHRTRSVTFTGMGTSEFVPEMIRDYLGDRCLAPVMIREAGELLHYGMPTIRDNDVIVAISQSGESIETRRVVEELGHHEYLVSVTNNQESTMARLAAVNIPMLAGEEASISTKTYTNSLAVMLLMGRAFLTEECGPVLDTLEPVADEMDAFYAGRQDEIRRAAEHLREAHTVYFISRGPALAAAKQAALTFQEGTHVFTCAIPGGSMRHGPFEIVGPGHHAVVFASDGRGGDLLRSMSGEMAELGSKVVLFTSREVPKQPNLLSIPLRPGDPERFPLACAVPQELLLHFMAEDRGWTAGVFLRGGKITARE